MFILGVETSCDETSVAYVHATQKRKKVITEFTQTQIPIHAVYGGVIPELAGRQHAEHIIPLIEHVLKNKKRPTVFAVATGPGLLTGLLMGMEAVRTLSYCWDIPIVSVNHLEGHMYASLVNTKNTIRFPALALIVSGGHTEIILLKKHGNYTRIGATRDDAAGECFDKIAKIMGLPYPGGPQIGILAEEGNPDLISLPKPMLTSHDFDFSFSGLKTAVLYYVRDNPDFKASDLAAAVQKSIVTVLIKKLERAVYRYAPKTVILGGGVSANTALRHEMHLLQKKHKEISFIMPEKAYTTDNAAMIAVAGYYHAIQKKCTPWQKLHGNPVWRLHE